jgi:hypothetical protein
MVEPETPLFLTSLARFRRLIIAVMALFWIAANSLQLAILITSFSAGSLFIHRIVRTINRRDDPRYATPPDPDSDMVG